jgi:hypothetical protein
VSGQEVSWLLYNGGAGVVEIFKIRINWPSVGIKKTRVHQR